MTGVAFVAGILVGILVSGSIFVVLTCKRDDRQRTVVADMQSYINELEDENAYLNKIREKNIVYVGED